MGLSKGLRGTDARTTRLLGALGPCMCQACLTLQPTRKTFGGLFGSPLTYLRRRDRDAIFGHLSHSDSDGTILRDYGSCCSTRLCATRQPRIAKTHPELGLSPNC